MALVPVPKLPLDRGFRTPTRISAARLAALIVLATLTGLTTAAAAVAATSRFAIPANAQQLIVVSSPTANPPGYLVTVRAYERAKSRSPWRPVFAAWPAETGYGHLRAIRHEGDGSTPTGVFAIGSTMYGLKPRPAGLHYRYHRLACGDWWDEDPYSSDYNRFVHVPCGVTPVFVAGSEALWTETTAYAYLAVIEFNMNPTVGGPNAPGSGIFLHSWVGGPTAGCVALHRPQLLKVLRWLRPSEHPVIKIEVKP